MKHDALLLAQMHSSNEGEQMLLVGTEYNLKGNHEGRDEQTVARRPSNDRKATVGAKLTLQL